MAAQRIFPKGEMTFLKISLTRALYARATAAAKAMGVRKTELARSLLERAVEEHEKRAKAPAKAAK